MKTIRKILAGLMVAVLGISMFAGTALAAGNKKQTPLYTGTIEDPILVYYGSQPFTQPFAFLEWALSNNKRQQPDYKGSVQDLGVGIVAELGTFFGKEYLKKTEVTFEDTYKDIRDGIKNGPDEIVAKVAEYVPIASDVYKLTGPVGKVTMQAFLLPGYLATNAGALAFVLIGGGAALLVIFGLTGVLSPLLTLEQGPLYIEQFFRDINEMQQAVKNAK